MSKQRLTLHTCHEADEAQVTVINFILAASRRGGLRSIAPVWFPSCDVCLGRHELISSLLSPKATGLPKKQNPLSASRAPEFT